ncbi:carbonic anhydrase-related protein 10-like [Saccostrea echinata]|uniref:carbonic anhydrase-related protein 10-like n=1 Tax=Saccostrea echinata TaxID=191078 RepID=UPI002A8229AB|nr:carbonic anhydrase-related protein 10-like [Saccostrea echinata]XP_061164248.1 carbonic anhydrase-related protein 10-like [Saccostrea echinata]
MDFTSSANSFIKTLLMTLFVFNKGYGQWSDWWMYSGFSGPSNWRINKDWILCSEGKLQSPINISAETLLFDPGLKDILVTGNRIMGNLTNLGNDVTFFVRGARSVTISLGPLPYVYKLSQIKFHFGRKDGMGTEHTIDGKRFDAEVHLMAYNSDLFHNYTAAERSPRGLAIISLFIKANRDTTHTEINKITSALSKIQFRGNTTLIEELSIQSILPENLQYMTYEGSVTQPGCYETVTWILLNRPIFMGEHQLNALRTLRRDTPENPQAFMFDNVRPVQSLHRRTVRTNINTNTKCPIRREVRYKVNKKVIKQ